MLSLRFALATCVLSLTLAGCGGGGGGGGGSSSDGSASAPTSTAAPADAPSSPSSPEADPDSAPVNSDITLSWRAPESRMDGSALHASDIASYEIYYVCDGAACTDTDGHVDATSGPETSAVVTLTSPGTWHFAVAAVDSSGVKSERSNTVSVTISGT